MAQLVPGYPRVVFNGLANDLSEISFEQAAAMYGFSTKQAVKESGQFVVDEVIGQAFEKSRKADFACGEVQAELSR